MDRDQAIAHWRAAAEAIDWVRAPETILDDSAAPLYRWYSDGQCNTCYNAIDRHVEAGRGDELALVYDSPVTDSVAYFTYRELRDRVAAFAGGLRELGVGPGDRVVIYMPMVPEAVIGMLACARLGAVHSVVFGGFAASELAFRIDDCRAKVVLSASCGIEHARIIPYKPLLDAAVEACAHKPAHCVILQREAEPAALVPGRDLDWETVAGTEPAPCAT
ncbi:MAG TPA: propionyl-CoA synthetase, partial [Halieaceae bacterium]|nr:propionyl-CoA synthetase [Halieaceae bacterium]